MKTENMDYSEQDIGVMLLESITRGLYVDARNAIREYIQNELDANATVINIDVKRRNIVISGNGVGMDDQDFDIAKKIGISFKQDKSNAGFRGIGIWAGIEVCDQVIIRTKKKGKRNVYQYHIDAKGIKEDMQNKHDLPLLDCLRSRVSTVIKPERMEKWGTIVILKNVIKEHENELLDVDELMKYLQQIAPVPINPKFPYQKKIEQKLTRNVPTYRPIKITLNGAIVYRPPANKDYLKPQYKMFSIAHKKVAFAWYCYTKTNIMIKNQSECSLIFKKEGITIGGSERAELLVAMEKYLRSDARLLKYYTGEIHIVSKSIVPNSERTNFESSTEYQILITQIQKFIEDLRTDPREESAKRSFERHSEMASNLITEYLASITFEERTNILKDFGRCLHNLKTDSTSSRLSMAKHELASEYIDRLQLILDHFSETQGSNPDEKLRKQLTKPSKTKSATKTKRKKQQVKSAFEISKNIIDPSMMSPEGWRIMDCVLKTVNFSIRKEENRERFIQRLAKCLNEKNR